MNLNELAQQLQRTKDVPFDYKERVKAELDLFEDGASFPEGPGTVHFGDNFISAKLLERDFKNEFTLGEENVAWRAKFPEALTELCFGKRKVDQADIKLKYWKPDGYSQEEMRMLHKVYVDGEHVDPGIIDDRWRTGEAYDAHDDKLRKYWKARVRAKHGYFPPFFCYGQQIDDVWNKEDPKHFFNGGLLLMGHGLDPNYEKHWELYNAQSQLQKKLKPGSTHTIAVEVYLWLLLDPQTVGMHPEESNAEKAAYIRDREAWWSDKQQGYYRRNVSGDGKVLLPITKCLARGEFTLKVPEDFKPSGMLPRFPYALNSVKDGPIVEIEKAQQDALKIFLQNKRGYENETFLWCNIMAPHCTMDAKDIGEDKLWKMTEFWQDNGSGRKVKKQEWRVQGLAYFYRREDGVTWKDDDDECSAGIVTAVVGFVGNGGQRALPLTVGGHSGFGPNVPYQILTDEDIAMTGFKP